MQCALCHSAWWGLWREKLKRVYSSVELSLLNQLFQAVEQGRCNFDWFLVIILEPPEHLMHPRVSTMFSFAEPTPFRQSWSYVPKSATAPHSSCAMEPPGVSVVVRGKCVLNWNVLDVKWLENHWRMSTFYINFTAPVLPHWRRTPAVSIQEYRFLQFRVLALLRFVSQSRLFLKREIIY